MNNDGLDFCRGLMIALAIVIPFWTRVIVWIVKVMR